VGIVICLFWSVSNLALETVSNEMKLKENAAFLGTPHS